MTAPAPRKKAPNKTNGKRNGAAGRNGGAGFGPGTFGPGMEMPPGALNEMFMPPMDPSAAIAEWLTRALSKGPIALVRLCQKSPEGEQAIADWDREEMEGQEADSLAEMFFSRAAEDAEGLDRIGRYVLLAYRDPSKPYVSRHFFRVAREDADSVFETEGANSTGLVSQAHRFAESYSRALLSGFGDMWRIMSTQLERLSLQNEEFANRHTELLLAQQAMLDRSQQRAALQKKADADLAREERRKTAVDAVAALGVTHFMARMGIAVPPQILAAFLPASALPPATVAPPAAPAQLGERPPLQLPKLQADVARWLVTVTRGVLDVLANAKEAQLDLILMRLPSDGDRQLVKKARAGVLEASERGGHIAETDEQKQLYTDFQSFLCGCLAGGLIDDLTLEALLGQLPPEAQDAAGKLKTALVSMRQQNGAPASPAAASANGASGEAKPS